MTRRSALPPVDATPMAQYPPLVNLITVAEFAGFTRRAAALLDQHDHDALVDFLSAHPLAGDVIPSTGGIRKLRWARAGGGKSGGFRVIYYFHSERMPLWLCSIYAKNEQADLTPDQKRLLSRMVETLVRESMG